MTSRRQTVPIDRRHFVTLCAAGTVMPTMSLGQSTQPANPDVVIIGAGAAGIAAAHELDRAGVSYVLLEATGHVGGRAFSESDTFGVPYDHGAHWVQSGKRNPYFKRAKASGHRFYKAPENYSIYTTDRVATADETDALWTAFGGVEKAMGRAGKDGRDIAPAAVAPTDSPWSKTAWFGIGPWEMGKDMDDFSCLDWWESSGSTDWYCAAGYGALVAEYAAGLQVALDTPVNRIKWGGPGVEVETPNGTIRARAVIITVSTGVLASEGIAFDPPLPIEKQEAFHAISMGYYNHVTLQFNHDIFEMGEDGYLYHQVDDSMEAFGALTNASGTGLAYCDVGGSFARELELAGQDAAIDFVKTKLRGLIGSDVDKHFMAATASEWGNNVYFRGCYASARPGQTHMRPTLRAPVAERLFFAGEACHADLWATVGGADLSGKRTAKAVTKALV